MLTDTDIQALETAAINRLQITVTYLKKTTGETVQHSGGVIELTSDGIMWFWDTVEARGPKKMYLSNIMSLQVLQVPFDNAAAGGFPLKINGQEIVGV